MKKGKIVVKLDKYLKDHKISRSSLAREGELRYDTVLSYCKGDITRFDSDSLAKLCAALNCKIQDIIEFVPNKS